MGMAAILLPFKQIVNNLSTEDPMWNLVEIVQADSEKFKELTILYTYIAQRQRQTAPKTLTVTKQFYFFNQTM